MRTRYYLVPGPQSHLSSGKLCPRFSSEHDFPFWSRVREEPGHASCGQGDGSSWVLWFKAHLFLLLSQPLQVVSGFLISQVVWTSFCVCRRAGRISWRVDLPRGGSEGREIPVTSPQTPAGSRVFFSGLPPGADWTSFAWFMGSWQDDSLWWQERQLNAQPLPFPRDPFLLLQPNAAQLRAQETKQSLLLKLKSFPWLIVPVALLLTILPPPLLLLLLLLPIPSTFTLLSLPLLLLLSCPL